jgi:hypothetical protein
MMEKVISTVTIANGASLSGVVALGNKRLAAIQMPAAWTAANLSFQGSLDGVTYQELQDSFGAALTVIAAASVCISVDVTLFAGWPYLKIRSGTSGTPVNQGAARTLQIGALALIG